jgi:hypothetical protein
MISFYHLLTFIAISGGFGLSYILRNIFSKHYFLVIAFFLLGIGIMTHMTFDLIINPHASVVSAMLNFEPWNEGNGLSQPYLWEELLITTQPAEGLPIVGG